MYRLTFSLFIGIWTILAVYGGRQANFVPKASFADWFYEFRNFLTLGVFVLLILITPKVAPAEKAKLRFLQKNPKANAILAASLMTAVLHFTAPHVLLRGAPGVHSLFTDRAPTAGAAIKVVKIGTARRHNWCSYTVSATGVQLIGATPIEVCDLDPAVWERLEPGDTIVLSGYLTAFGMRYETFWLPQ